MAEPEDVPVRAVWLRRRLQRGTWEDEGRSFRELDWFENGVCAVSCRNVIVRGELGLRDHVWEPLGCEGEGGELRADAWVPVDVVFDDECRAEVSLDDAGLLVAFISSITWAYDSHPHRVHVGSPTAQVAFWQLPVIALGKCSIVN